MNIDDLITKNQKKAEKIRGMLDQVKGSYTMTWLLVECLKVVEEEIRDLTELKKYP